MESGRKAIPHLRDLVQIKIVIGGNFGDEGKGLMTDYFAAEAVKAGRKTLVVLSNGGAQRGHTVTTPSGVRHVFHHFGSGTLAGADTRLPRFFIVNPMIFMNEVEELITKGVRFAVPRMPGRGSTGNEIHGHHGEYEKKEGIRILMDPECPVTTPYDMITNQIIEESRGKGRHGSCGVGIWETLHRDGLPLGEMADMPDPGLYEYLDGECREQMKCRLKAFGIRDIPERWRDIVYSGDLLLNYIRDFRDMCSIAVFCGEEIMKEYDRVIFEAGQGLLLDRLRKEFGCHTTPSNTGLRNPAELIREYTDSLHGPEVMDVEVCYVTRTYLTRHGAGPFKEECGKDEINPDMKDLTNVPNPHQGTLRYGKPDVAAFLMRIREDYDSERFPTEWNTRMTLAVTHENEYMPKNLMGSKADYHSDGETRISVRKRTGDRTTGKKSLMELRVNE